MHSTAAEKDPVCGMEVDPANAAGRTEHRGQTYYFCCSMRKANFETRPEQYLGNPAGTP